jgi:pimeloyl-ACP methyl ester carboxylesterase
MPTAADIYYHTYQEGEKLPVVLLHGAGGSHLSWPSEIRRLSGFRVFALDLPGHGKSGGRGYQTVSSYADAVLNWLEAMGMHSAVFIGHSMGSAIGQTLALDHPEHVLGLVLLGSAPRLRVNPVLIEESAHQTTFFNAVEKVVEWSFSPQTPDRLKTLVAKRLAETRPSVLHGDFQACNAYDMTSRIFEITQPTLVMCGSEDRMTPARNAYFLVDSLPCAQLEIIPEAGHMVMIEKPVEVARVISSFLAGIPY